MKMFFKKIFLAVLFFSLWGIYAQKQPAYVNWEKNAARQRMQFRPSANTGNYDLTYGRLDLVVDPRRDSISGSVFFRFTALADLSQIFLDMSPGLTADSVRYHGTTLTPTALGGQIRIDLPATVNTGASDSLQVFYHGNPDSSGYGSFTTDSHNGVPVLWTLSEPYGAKDWWPTKQDLIDKIDSVDVIIRYPAQIDGHRMKAVSNGREMSESVSGGIKTTRWHHGHPIPAYLVAIAVTDYAEITQTAGLFQSFPIRHFVYPEDSLQAQIDLPVTADLMDYFENTFGQYPFSDEKYGHAQFGWGGGMEHTTITFIGGFWRGVVAHELAHHWFGDDVTCGSWSDIWLNEGFATYAEALTQDYFDGADAFKAWRDYAVNEITAEPGGGVYKHGADTLDIDEVFSWPNTYLKGAMVLHMLRFRLGDSLFFGGLRQYLNDFAYGYARTEDFRSVMENYSGEDLSGFFNDWVYGKGFPDYNVHWQNLSGGVYRINLEQQTTDASVDFFETPLRIRFYGGSQTYDTIVFHNQNPQNFVLQPGFTADSIRINPDTHIIIGQTNYLKEQDYTWQSDILQFPNPITARWTVWVRRPQDVRRIFLTDMTGKVVLDQIRPFVPLNTGFLTRGVYLLNVQWNGRRALRKVIKQ